MDIKREFFFSTFYSYLGGVVLLIMTLLTSSVLAQDREVKTDSLIINDTISGIREFEYDTAKGEDVYDGKFNFQSVSESKIGNFDYEAITYNGEYSSDLKHGDWSYSEKKLKQIDKKFVSDFKIGNLTSGIENKISGTFQEGKAIGNWQAVKQDFIESEIEDTLFFVQSTFKNNQLVGGLQSKSPSVTIEGYFNADGYFHGKWEVKHTQLDPPVKEYRTYDAGILESYEVVYEGETYTILYPGLDNSMSAGEEWIDFSLQDGYFEILNLLDLEIKESVSSSVDFTIEISHKKTNEFIRNSILAFSFNSGYDIWGGLKGSEPLVLGKFKVRKFEFSTEEKEQIEEISNSFDNIKTILKEFKENPKVKIGKPVYEKFNEVELVFSVYRNEISQLGSMVDVLSSKAFEYVDRDAVFNKTWPSLRFPVEVTYEFQSELVTKSHEFPETPKQENFDLAQALELIKNIEKDIESMNEEANEIFEAMEIEKSLSQDEEKLVKRKDEIETLFNNTEEESFNEYHERYSSLVLALVEKSFNEYGNSDVEAKKKRIKPLLSCFNNLVDFYSFLEDLEAKDNRLNDAYTRTTFNPYMMVDMSERIKESIYTAFDEVLRPYLFQKLEDDFNCENIGTSMEDINKVYQKILDLSKRDTREEEKELKRQRNPEAILSVLELELQY